MDETKTDEGDELTAMQAIANALSPLEPNARRRVMIWINDRFELGQLPMPRLPKSAANTSVVGDPSVQNADAESIATLFDRASPSSDAEKVLLVAYWMQEISHESVTAVRVNKALKDLGHQVGHINRVFTGLIEQKPSLIMQTHRSGKTKQGRRTYKVTNEGIKRARAMLGSGQTSPEE
ncbi:MAG: hypothetical protein ACYDH4_08015 [Candidatus Cryosericum sp.]